MSRWLNEPMTIGIATDRVAIGKGVWPRDSLRHRLELRLHRAPAEEAPVSFDIPSEQSCTETGLIDTLAAALAQTVTPTDAATRPQATRRARVVLDDFWGYHTIVHGDFRALRAPEVEEIVLAHFADLHGIDAASVLVRFAVQRGGRAVFASALARSLYDAVHETARAADVTIRSLTLWLPVRLHALRSQVARRLAMLLFVDSALLQAVLVDGNGWVGYDAQRRFRGDLATAARITGLAEQAFERAAPRVGAVREACDVYLFGEPVDSAAFEGRFRSAIRPAWPGADWPLIRQNAEAEP